MRKSLLYRLMQGINTIPHLEVLEVRSHLPTTPIPIRCALILNRLSRGHSKQPTSTFSSAYPVPPVFLIISLAQAFLAPYCVLQQTLWHTEHLHWRSEHWFYTIMTLTICWSNSGLESCLQTKSILHIQIAPIFDALRVFITKDWQTTWLLKLLSIKSESRPSQYIFPNLREVVTKEGTSDSQQWRVTTTGFL